MLHLSLKWFKNFPLETFDKGEGLKSELQGFRVPISFESLHNDPLDAFQSDLPSVYYPQLGAEDVICHILYKYFGNGHISDHILWLSLDLISELLRKNKTKQKNLKDQSGICKYLLSTGWLCWPKNLVEKWIIIIILYNIYWTIITCQALCWMPCMCNLIEFLQWTNEESGICRFFFYKVPKSWSK